MADHIQPVALGGSNDDSNLVTTSGVHNAMKAQYTLEELGWKLHAPGDLKDWDGLIKWAMSYCKKSPQILDVDHPAGSIRPWHKAEIRRAAPERREFALQRTFEMPLRQIA